MEVVLVLQAHVEVVEAMVGGVSKVAEVMEV